MTPQPHACASRAPECTCLQADLSVCAKECLWSETSVSICSLGGLQDPNSLLFPRVQGSEWEPEALVLCREGGENSREGFQRLRKESSAGGRKMTGRVGGEKKRERASLLLQE